MLSVVMHVDGHGAVWAMAKCRVCREVHKYVAAEVIAHQTLCKSCGRAMDIQGAVISATRQEPRRAGVLQPSEGTVDAH